MQKSLQSHFSFNPTSIDLPRSRFSRPYDHKLTFNAGRLIPIYVDSDILPGDTVEMDLASVVRENTPIFPVMDNAYMDVYAFFVPHRIVWKHWQEFMGENTTDAWTQKTDYSVPVIRCNRDAETGTVGSEENYKHKVLKGSVLDYMGIPIDDLNLDTSKYAHINKFEINALPIRAYYKIWNDWFRNENTDSPIPIEENESTIDCYTEFAGSSYTNARIQCGGGKPLKVARFHDYFSSALPSPQKGQAVLIPFSGDMPVVGTTAPLGLKNYYWKTPIASGKETYDGSENFAMNMSGYIAKTKEEEENYLHMSGTMGISSAAYNTELKDSNSIIDSAGTNPDSILGKIGVTNEVGKSGMIATTAGATLTATINQLRQAFAVQKLMEAYARGGTRYTEILKSVFGVQSSDARLQRPEYLGGTRFTINMDSIVQTSESSATSPQGNVAGYSVSGMADRLFTKSFEEHGTLMVVACLRSEHSYQQGLNRMWSKKDQLDYYYPQLANIGEVGIRNKEIYLQGEKTNPTTGGQYDEEIFGYQEAWAEYRYKPNEVSGAFRSVYPQSLDAYHYGDAYSSMPTLSTEWMLEDGSEIDRTIAVQSSLEDQFYGDFYFSCIYTRPMPTYSIPGLIDHH